MFSVICNRFDTAHVCEGQTDRIAIVFIGLAGNASRGKNKAKTFTVNKPSNVAFCYKQEAINRV